MAWLSDTDLFLWNTGQSRRAYRRFGAHPIPGGGVQFTVWAPNARSISVVGDWNGWNPDADPLTAVGDSGVWTGYVAAAEVGNAYKIRVNGHHGFRMDKTDPFAFRMEAPHPDGHPLAGLSSIVTDLSGYDWGDADWMAQRKGPSGTNDPMAIYEVHLGSWRRHYDGRPYTYRELAEPLADYAAEMGFTHIELLPVNEHPYYGSWGYQAVGYYAATYRYGSPQDLMFLIDTLHRRGLGVILDWVPAHFAMDPQGLGFFDGAPLYEPTDPLMRTHPDWGTYTFDYEKPGVRSFLLSNALFWLDVFHIDGLRVDAVASMVYRNYSRNRFTPNRFGGTDHLEAISLLQEVNTAVFEEYPEAITAAEESTAFPGVSRPVYEGGLGFLYKWNMGWMHDTLEFWGKDPVYRPWHHHALTFPLHYAFSERFILPLSHDEVVHLKKPLLYKMPGDAWRQAANLRLLFGHQIGHPGKKLVFMGGEFGQTTEWNHDRELDWPLLAEPLHQGIHRWTTDLLHLYRSHPALHDDTPDGFQWLVADDVHGGTAAYVRESADRTKRLIFAFNFTPVPRENVRLGALPERRYRVVLSSDDLRYGGSGTGTFGETTSHPVPGQHWPGSVVVMLPPLGVIVLEEVEDAPPAETNAAAAALPAPTKPKRSRTKTP